jgi:deazaflavin-dependent oxidoreductase (nitroreductase family)
MSDMNDFNAKVIDEFRANGGKAGGMFEGKPLVLVHNVGARSGTEYVTPLVYLDEDGRTFIFGSKGGADNHPGWFHNLKANPETKIEIGTDTVEVTAVEITGPERDRIYEVQKAQQPQFADYEANTERTIPVVELAPKSA